MAPLAASGAVDPTGPTTVPTVMRVFRGGGDDPANEYIIGSGTDALFTMAAETDGDFVRNANQLGPEIERVADSQHLILGPEVDRLERAVEASEEERRRNVKWLEPEVVVEGDEEIVDLGERLVAEAQPPQPAA